MERHQRTRRSVVSIEALTTVQLIRDVVMAAHCVRADIHLLDYMSDMTYSHVAEQIVDA